MMQLNYLKQSGITLKIHTRARIIMSNSGRIISRESFITAENEESQIFEKHHYVRIADAGLQRQFLM